MTPPTSLALQRLSSLFTIRRASFSLFISEVARCKGDLPSLLTWLTSAPCSMRQLSKRRLITTFFKGWFRTVGSLRDIAPDGGIDGH